MGKRTGLDRFSTKIDTNFFFLPFPSLNLNECDLRYEET